MLRCLTCRRELKDESAEILQRVQPGLRQEPGQGTPASPGRNCGAKTTQARTLAGTPTRRGRAAEAVGVSRRVAVSDSETSLTLSRRSLPGERTQVRDLMSLRLRGTRQR